MTVSGISGVTQGSSRRPATRPPRLPEWKSLAAALLLSAAILVVFRGAYWRPFDDQGQESAASFHAYGFQLLAPGLEDRPSHPLSAAWAQTTTARARSL
jgi:hypothetical protein